MSRCEIDILVDIHRIVNIQNVLRENSDFLTTFLDKRRILRTHVDDKKKNLTSFQKDNFCKHILTIISRNLLKTTKKYCLKFSQKHIIFSSKKIILSISQMSKKIRLTILKFHFRCIEISFQKINLTFLINSARSIFFLIKQMFSSFEFKDDLSLIKTLKIKFINEFNQAFVSSVIDSIVRLHMIVEKRLMIDIKVIALVYFESRWWHVEEILETKKIYKRFRHDFKLLS